jgi:hypothetical protein
MSSFHIQNLCKTSAYDDKLPQISGIFLRGFFQQIRSVLEYIFNFNGVLCLVFGKPIMIALKFTEVSASASASCGLLSKAED